MRVLIVVPQQDRVSGNWVTAKRFQLGLEQRGHQVRLLSTPLQGETNLRQQIASFAPDVALLLHAYRSGRPWLEAAAGLQIPYLVLLTGTDVNQGLDHPQQRPIIATTIKQAAFVLLHNPLIAREFATEHPELAVHLHVIAPGITLGDAPYALRQRHGIATGLPLFLCPAGLRPVKGQLELLQIFDAAVSLHDSLHLAFCGPVLDPDYGKSFQAEIASRPWASYLGSIPTAAMANAMRAADVVINNSQSEGLANSLLEAASLGIPILARNNPGNAAVVRHNRNGLLFENPEDCIKQASQLLQPQRRRQLSRPDPGYSPEQEANELELLLGAAGRADKQRK